MEAYPLDLRTVLASKSRSQPATFTTTEPRRGYAYSQAIGTDVPVFWSVNFAFNQADAIRFQLWFKHKINKGLDEFTLPIRTEFGTIEHVCKFLPDSLLDHSQSGKAYSYSATIMARALTIPTEFDDAADLIVSLPDWEDYAHWLDIAITNEWMRV